MSRTEFLKEIDEILELDPGTLKGPELLEDYPLWDSTAIISFMAAVDTANGTKLSPRELGNCETVEDLLKIAKIEA